MTIKEVEEALRRKAAYVEKEKASMRSNYAEPLGAQVADCEKANCKIDPLYVPSIRQRLHERLARAQRETEQANQECLNVRDALIHLDAQPDIEKTLDALTRARVI